MNGSSFYVIIYVIAECQLLFNGGMTIFPCYIMKELLRLLDIVCVILFGN